MTLGHFSSFNLESTSNICLAGNKEGKSDYKTKSSKEKKGKDTSKKGQASW